jgi:bacillithiol system protein YtxJ
MAPSDLEQRAQLLRTAEEVEAFLGAHPDAVLFKAGSCHRTDSALETLGPVLRAHPGLPVGLIRVVESRAASQHAAALSGVRHQSPQVLIFSGGKVVLARDNWEISGAAVEEALGTHVSPKPASAETIS